MPTLEALEQRVELLERRVSEWEGQLGFLVPLVRQLHREILAAREDSQSLVGKVDLLEQRIVRLENKVDRLENKVDQGFASMSESFATLTGNSLPSRRHLTFCLVWSRKKSHAAAE